MPTCPQHCLIKLHHKRLLAMCGHVLNVACSSYIAYASSSWTELSSTCMFNLHGIPQVVLNGTVLHIACSSYIATPTQPGGTCPRHCLFKLRCIRQLILDGLVLQNACSSYNAYATSPLADTQWPPGGPTVVHPHTSCTPRLPSTHVTVVLTGYVVKYMSTHYPHAYG